MARGKDSKIYYLQQELEGARRDLDHLEQILERDPADTSMSPMMREFERAEKKALKGLQRWENGRFGWRRFFGKPRKA